MSILIIIFFIVISFIQLYGMKKKKLWKEAGVYSFIMLIAFIYALGLIYDWNLPTISKFTTSLFEPLSSNIDKMAK